ncbi:MAG: hypothetical protein PHY12_00290 [Eubacteriales bacterium]|nr:hypothetical protein [Eubacteriales bacterium]
MLPMAITCNFECCYSGFTNTGTLDLADHYTDAVVSYQSDNVQVRFRKKTQKWAPPPRKGSSDLLSQFGFLIQFLCVRIQKRIEVKPDDLRAGNLIQASNPVKQSMNTLFETEKYSRLMRLRNTNGRGRQTTYFYVIKDRNRYYSEKRFSTGELAIVRLVEKVESVVDTSLVLLDKAELALHPRVQVKLYDYLKRKAEVKNLTILISTHSPSLIKTTSPECIFLLDDPLHKGQMAVVNPCFPAAAVGSVDYDRSMIFDYIFFVEDLYAVSILKYMIKRHMTMKPEISKALCNIIPVGGFAQTAEMAVRTSRRTFAQLKVRAIVDQDAFGNIDSKPKFKEMLRRHHDMITGFGFTPENWLIQSIEESDAAFRQSFREEFRLELETVTGDPRYVACNSPKPRQLAKEKFGVVIAILGETLAESADVSADHLIKLIVEPSLESAIRQTLDPVL